MAIAPEKAREALDRHSWAEAYRLLSDADASSELPPADLELLGEAAWWAGRMDDCVSARERAQAAYVAAGDNRKAAMVALALVRDHGNRLAGSVAAGWLRRAERLLEAEPDCVEKGYLQMMVARREHGQGRFDQAVELAGSAVETGMRFGDPDLQALSLMYQGMALVGRGDVEEGFSLLDEATVAAVGGELKPGVTGIVYCNMILTCQEVTDYRRAGEWTEAARRWCERQSISGFPGLCRVHRAEIIRLRGAWAEAEMEARRACEELTAFGFPGIAGEAFYEVGEIRLRMGDMGAAEEAFTQANELGRDPQPGLALLRLAQGRVEDAFAVITRSLEDTVEPLYRARRLPALVEIALAADRTEEAERAVRELEEIAARYGSDALHATACSARAELALALSDPPTAIEHARRSVDLWRQVEAPYEAALGRGLLGRAYLRAGDTANGELELTAARAALEKLGAVADARDLGRLLEQKPSRAVRTFVFTDIVRSTSLLEAIGDEAWEDLVGWHDRTLRSLFTGHGGQEIDHAGDGFFVAFEEAAAALRCAIAIQRTLAEHRQVHGFAPQVRIGVHVAEAMQRDVVGFGGKGVHEAARIGALAQGGEVVASVETIEAAGEGFPHGPARPVALRGINTPVQVVDLHWQ